ncbi:hypothetical protein ACQYWQ_21725 [Streptomyces sp. P6-2-1]|uniref:hypothetical protein n=1 Tax=unclassified Streptomyces TaxID=2593676 RepID=UPI003D366283
MPYRKPAALALLAATATLLSPLATAHADTSPRAASGETEPSAHGRVIAREGLSLRDSPRRAGTEVGRRPYGDSVAIHCAMRGERVQGEDRWYLLTDGTWVPAPSRSIATEGAAPRTC